MTDADVKIDRSTAMRWLAYAALTLATLAGLFAMHGLPMTMPTAMPMPTATAMPSAMPMSTSVAVESSAAPTSVPSMKLAIGDTSSAVRLGAVTKQVSSAAAASIGASPSGSHGGCDAEHDGCLATLRGQPHPPSPTPITLTSAVAGPASLVSDPSRAGLLRGPPPPRPRLTELCISRT